MKTQTDGSTSPERKKNAFVKELKLQRLRLQLTIIINDPTIRWISDISSFYIVQNDDVPSQDLPRRILFSFTVAASIGQFEFKINVFLELLEDYKIDTETTMLRRKGWKPQMQLMIRIGTARKNDTPLLSLEIHLQNPATCPDLEHPHQEVQSKRAILMRNKTVQTEM